MVQGSTVMEQWWRCMQLTKRVIINADTGEMLLEDIGEQLLHIEELRSSKLAELMELYKNSIIQGFYSSATGESVFYGYNPQDQLNYSKWANVLALNPNKASVIIGSISHGVVSMTREQFMQFMEDAELYEVTMYQRRKEIEKAIIEASDIDGLNAVQLSF